MFSFGVIIWPSFMCITRSVIRAKDSSCVTMTNVCPISFLRSKKSLCNSSLFWVSRLPDGSSAKITSGWFINARQQPLFVFLLRIIGQVCVPSYPIGLNSPVSLLHVYGRPKIFLFGLMPES